MLCLALFCFALRFRAALMPVLAARLGRVARAAEVGLEEILANRGEDVEQTALF